MDDARQRVEDLGEAATEPESLGAALERAFAQRFNTATAGKAAVAPAAQNGHTPAGEAAASAHAAAPAGEAAATQNGHAPAEGAAMIAHAAVKIMHAAAGNGHAGTEAGATPAAELAAVDGSAGAAVSGGLTGHTEPAGAITPDQAGAAADAQVGGASAAAAVEAVPAAAGKQSAQYGGVGLAAMEVDGAAALPQAGMPEQRLPEQAGAVGIEFAADGEAAPNGEASETPKVALAAESSEKVESKAEPSAEASKPVAANGIAGNAEVAEPGQEKPEVAAEKDEAAGGREDEDEDEDEEVPLPDALSEGEERLLGWHWANLEYGCSARLDQVGAGLVSSICEVLPPGCAQCQDRDGLFLSSGAGPKRCTKVM